MQQFVKTNLIKIIWIITILAVAICLLGWGQQLKWDFKNVNGFQLFPVFGLLAFAIMWSHFAAYALRLYAQEPPAVTRFYSMITGVIVLLSLLLHPAILTWQLFSNSMGLPPTSYFRYVGTMSAAYIIIAEIALVIFLAYELHRRYSDRSWWKYVNLANYVAMLLIIVHALMLGSAMYAPWFKTVWIVMAVILVLIYGYIYRSRKV